MKQNTDFDYWQESDANLFTCNTPPSTPYQEPLVGVAIVVAVISAGLGFLIYFIKRK